MNSKRIAAFVATVVIALGVVVATMPFLLSSIRLGLDLKGGFEILYVAEPLEGQGEVTHDALVRTAQSLERRANQTGVEEPDIVVEGKNRIRVRIAGVTDEAKVREILKKPVQLTFRSAEGCKDAGDYCKIELLGTDFKEGAAKVVYDQLNRPVVEIEVKDKAKFADVTRRLVGKPLAIYLNDELLSAPVVQQELTDGRAQITGSYTYEEAKQLADTINLGALPLKLTEKYTQSVGATLGQRSLEQTLTAGVVGSILILVFMLAVYRLPGIVAAVSLIVYTWALLGLFVLMNATMTLPGIAAFVLGMGMAVDANIITYERIREEIRSGKSLLSSLKAGSRQSLRTILDANLTTVLAAAVLYYVGGAGAIKGFSLTLILSIAVSMLSNVLFSRFLLYLLIRSNLWKKPEHFGVRASEITDLKAADSEKRKSEARRLVRFDFVRHRNRFFAGSLAITALGVATLAVFGFNYGVDFKAGTSLDVVVGKPVDKAKAVQLLETAIGERLKAQPTIGGVNGERVSARFDRVLSSEEINRVKDAFAKEYGTNVAVEENTVDPVIARELGRNAMIAVAIASVGIMLYVAVRFEWRFALAAIVALLHDAFIVISVFSLFRLEVNLPFVAAVLTIIGYSINDTIVIFDRIRENLRFAKLRSFDDLANLVNRSVWQTMARSINTVLTVLFASVMLLILGSESIRLFSLAMTVGLVAGAYSSVCIASSIWILLKKGSIGRSPAAKPETP
ncbi:MAG: preprotein translocase subunit SecD [Candidatus Reconcilbacillus cellulovorans]|uniref:Multifunctional fusion protein n=1 Tax=Candidatus Reconcilbacillus cellulovorans TaxID=1906605 RepID=A0A2A6DYV1_9BACL|nr:MAG: preprotein translocase subunit SecD [Candidatus Reconcilbacillus cellulovorans]